MNAKSLENLYQDTLTKLKEGQRPQIKLSLELTALLKAHWTQSLHQVLCILSHTQNTSAEFHDLLLQSFQEKNHEPETLIFLLGVSEKHIISHSLMTGNLPPHEFFEILKILLRTKNPEVLEWTLRTIESMGPLNFRLQQDIRSARPGFRKIFNSHLRACDEIINLLEIQWKRM